MNILVSASDPGGGNAVLPVVRELQKKKEKVLCIIGGAAKNIFQGSGVAFLDGDIIKKIDIKKIFSKTAFTLFVFGSSIGKNTIEKKLLAFTGKNTIPSVCILDFWTNYWQRFSTHKKDFKYFPDYIFVMDSHAKREMIQQGFKEKTIFVTGNPYFDIFTKHISVKNEDPCRILFISQPLSEDMAHVIDDYGYDENRALKDVLEVLAKINSPYRLVIRLHPREKKGKHNMLLKKNIFPAEYDDEKNLEKSLSRAGIILGMNSTVLFQAALARKRVISYQPNMKQDVLNMNRVGLSALAITPTQLEKILKKYYNVKHSNIRPRKNIIPKDALKNVMKCLYSLV